MSHFNSLALGPSPPIQPAHHSPCSVLSAEAAGAEDDITVREQQRRRLRLALGLRDGLCRTRVLAAPAVQYDPRPHRQDRGQVSDPGRSRRGSTRPRVVNRFLIDRFRGIIDKCYCKGEHKSSVDKSSLI